MLKARSGVLAVITSGLVLTFPAAPASADSPAFWGYWHAGGSAGAKWAFAQTGPATAHPKDGSVEGWRFAKSKGDTGTPPRDSPAAAASGNDFTWVAHPACVNTTTASAPNTAVLFIFLALVF